VSKTFPYTFCREHDAEIDSLGGKIDSLEEQIVTLEKVVSALQEKIDKVAKDDTLVKIQNFFDLEVKRLDNRIEVVELQLRASPKEFKIYTLIMKGGEYDACVLARSEEEAIAVLTERVKGYPRFENPEFFVAEVFEIDEPRMFHETFEG